MATLGMDLGAPGTNILSTTPSNSYGLQQELVWLHLT